jgi:glycosyltransferase involved in cell wall biosynthesis
MDSLMIQTYPLSELIIIDSGDQELDNIIKKYKLNVKYIKYKAGLTAARNRGIKKSKGDIIIFLDDDVILDSEYIYNIISIFKNFGKEVAAVCGDIISDEMRSKRFPNYIKYSFIKKIRKLSFGIFFLCSWGDGKFQPSGFPTLPIGKKEILFIECLQGANMAYRKEILDEFKFDEKLHGYCFMEDCDISYRVAQEYKIVYTPHAKLVHNVSSASRDSEFLRMKMLLENHHYLFKKNFPQKSYNRFAFWISVLGLFLISFLGMHIDEIKGLNNGLKFIIRKGGL